MAFLQQHKVVIDNTKLLGIIKPYSAGQLITDLIAIHGDNWKQQLLVPDPNDFDSLTLNFDHKGLTDLSEIPFELLHNENIRILSARNNFIDELPVDFIIEALKLPSLYRIDLANNRIASLPVFPTKLVSKSPSKLSIDLSNNKIKSVPPNVFYGADIQYLDLHNNKINSIAEKAFDGHNALKYLYLHKNKLKIIPINTFKVLDNLKFLSLDKNSLGSKEQYIFPANAGVEFYPQGVPTLKLVVAQGLAKELEDKNLNEVIKIMQRIPLDQLDALFKAASAKTQAIMSQALQIISAPGYIRYRDVIETKKKTVVE